MNTLIEIKWMDVKVESKSQAYKLLEIQECLIWELKEIWVKMATRYAEIK